MCKRLDRLIARILSWSQWKLLASLGFGCCNLFPPVKANILSLPTLRYQTTSAAKLYVLVLGNARELALSFSIQVLEQYINVVIIGRKQKLLHNCLNESLCSGMRIFGDVKKYGPAPAFIAGPGDLELERKAWGNSKSCSSIPHIKYCRCAVKKT